MAAIAPLLWVAVFHTFNLYSQQHLSALEEFRRIISAVSVGLVLVVMASFWSNSSFSRIWVGLTWIFALLGELGLRRGWRWYQDKLKTDGQLSYRTLIVGATDEASRLAEILDVPGSGFTPLGHVHYAQSSSNSNSLPILGDIGNLRDLIREHAAECLFVASAALRVEDMNEVTRLARQEAVEVRVAANLPQTLTSRLALQQVGPAIAVSLKPVRLTGLQAALKRIFDLLVASVVLLATLPLWVMIAAAIRLTSRGPIFFRQSRVTKGGCIFTMYKFRTMRQNPGSAVGGQPSIELTKPFFKLADDPRVTRVGHLIRRLSLDELPQLLNVIKGDMSLVGPRPLPLDQVAANLELLEPRHEVLAGVTGWWQINGRSHVTPEEALRLDLFYIENWSLTLDLFIVGKTLGAILSGNGAY